MKEKGLKLLRFLQVHIKVVLPVVLMLLVALTVAIALSAGHAKEEALAETESAESAETETAVLSEDVPLVSNEDGAIYTLVVTFYNAMATGDEETLRSVCDEISDKDMYRYLALAEYIDHYPTIEIYTKTGPEEGSVIAYVYYQLCFVNQDAAIPGYQALYLCTNEDGSYYIKRGENTDEVNEYIQKVSTQDDVVEFNNKITVEYNELMTAQPELLQYINELDSQVSITVGEKLAASVSSESTETDTTAQEGEAAATADGAQTDTGSETESTTTATETQYATATTTVNVRSSDSENADKLGKVSGGTKLEVVEQKVNGWTEVIYEGSHGFIKSEYLQIAESASNVESIGTVTATTNINVRAAASETADRIGILSGGDSAELVGTEGDWSKIKYNGQIGYVKSEYVQ